MSFPRYPSYKDSGVEWLGEVPEVWEICEGKRVFCSRRQIAVESDPQLAASQKFGVIPQSLMMELNDSKVMLALKGTEAFRHVEKDDFVISLRSFEGGIEHSKYTGCVSPAYTVLNSSKPIESGFFRHLFKSGPYVSALQSTTDSLRDGKSISYQQFGAIPLPLPPLDEQQTIAAFLDRETAKIDALVAEQENLIALLKEKRQAVISHAVTKGLDPTVPMKDSGIEWLGDVPAHWSVCPLRWYASCQSGDGISGSDIEAEADENFSVPSIGGNGIMGYTNQANTFSKVLAIGRVGALCGNVHLINPPAWISDNALMLSASDQFDLLFLEYVLRSRNLNEIASKTAQPLITGTQVRDQRIPLPPMQEQIMVVEFLISETAKLDTLTAEAQRGIDLLKERRSALISAAVTGKIDVRGYRAQPPPII